jgi:hypothetical protein
MLFLSPPVSPRRLTGVIIQLCVGYDDSIREGQLGLEVKPWFEGDGQLRLTSRSTRTPHTHTLGPKTRSWRSGQWFSSRHLQRILSRSKSARHPDRSSAQPGKRRVLAGLFVGKKWVP